MSADDLHSFVGKFIALWNNGRDVTLQFRSSNGKAKVTMELDIESLAPLPIDGGRTLRQARRREKRANLRQKSTAEEALVENVAVNDVVVEPLVVNNKVDDYGHDVEDIAEVTDIANSDSDEVVISSIPVENEEVTVLCVPDKNEEVGVPCVTDKTEEVGVSCTDKTEEVVVSCVSDKTEPIGEVNVTDGIKEENSCVTVKTEEVTHSLIDSSMKGQEVSNRAVTVWSKIHFDNCCNKALTSNHLKSLEGIIFRKDHLRQNIKSIEYGHYGTERCSDGAKYDHTLDVKLGVYTERLWETPRSYIWRHMGQDTWTFQDGMQICMNRIHVKD